MFVLQIGQVYPKGSSDDSRFWLCRHIINRRKKPRNQLTAKIEGGRPPPAARCGKVFPDLQILAVEPGTSHDERFLTLLQSASELDGAQEKQAFLAAACEGEPALVTELMATV